MNRPDLTRAIQSFEKFCQTIRALRDPSSGCPWDLKQTHKSLAKYALEESYELAEAIESGDMSEIKSELGDVLLQVVLHSQLASENGSFEIADVIEEINKKMIRRHPHVFDPKVSESDITEKEIKDSWRKIKAEEKGEESVAPWKFKRHKFPATMEAVELGHEAALHNFDWDRPDEVFQKFLSEITELKEELAEQSQSMDRIQDEIGDVYFSLAQVCRHLGIDPEIAHLQGNTKFLTRFSQLHRVAADKGITLKDTDKSILENLWVSIKESE